MKLSIMTYEQERAAERAADLATPFLKRQEWRRDHMYRGWMLEPVIDTFGDRIAITRSNYGYRVLNTPDLGMVDVDFNLDFNTVPQQREVLSNLREWVTKHPGQSWRVYRTAAGLRLLRTDAPQPLDQSYGEVVSAVWGADTLYAKLCVEQRAFRARLSPKPKRIGIKYPDWNPYDEGSDGWSQSERTKVPLTIEAYEILQTQYKTCELVEVIGSGNVHNDLRHVLRVHDTFCKVDIKLPMEPLAEDEDGRHCGPTDMQILAFHEVYRPCGMAPDLVWDILSPSVSGALRCSIPDRGRIMQQWDEQMALGNKWETSDHRMAREADRILQKIWLAETVSAEGSLEQLKKGAYTGQGFPLSHYEPHAGECTCEDCIAARERSASISLSVNKVNIPEVDDNDTDYFAKLAQNAVLNG